MRLLLHKSIGKAYKVLTQHASMTAGARKACKRGDECDNEVRGDSASAWRLCDDHDMKAWETEYGSVTRSSDLSFCVVRIL